MKVTKRIAVTVCETPGMPMITTPMTPEEIRRMVTVQVGLTAAFGGVMVLLLDGANAPHPPIWSHVVLGLVIATGAVFAFRSPRPSPLDPSTTDAAAHDEALLRLANVTARRAAYSGAPFLVVVLAAFVIDHAAWPILIMGPVALTAMAWATWPSRRFVARTAEALEAEGAATRLREAFA